MPDVLTFPEAFIGWRGWRLDPHTLRLRSINTEVEWEPCKHVEAICPKSRRHPVPLMNCTCGFYSTKSLEQLRENNYHAMGAFGQVRVWGRVIEYSEGFRSQFCYPDVIYLPYLSLPLIERLSVYDVPVRLLNPYTGEPDIDGDWEAAA